MILTPVLPRRLRLGDRVVAVSPSSTITDRSEEAVRAKEQLARHLDIKVDLAEHAFASYYYSAGTTQQRRHDLMAAITDPDVTAVFFTTGGSTAIDVLESLDYEAIRENPKIIAGLSDCSTILNAITAKTGLVTFHGLEMFDHAKHEMPYATASIQSILFDGWSGAYTPNPSWRDLEGDRTTYSGWRSIKSGQATGTAVGGNSEALTQLIASPYCPSFEGAILFLETYRLQKRHLQALLASLRLRGVLDQIAGLVIGYCLGSDDPGTGNERDLADIVTETTQPFTFPVLQIGEIGHQVENLILPLGANVSIDSNGPVMTLDAPVVV